MQAKRDFNIDLSQSYMIGDSEMDVKAGGAAGCKESILVEINKKNVLLDVVCEIIER
jgi:histidinol phosphatase-like enzyme